MTDTSTNQQKRTDYIAGLRQLADILEQHPSLNLPYHGTTSELMWIATYGEDHKQIAREFARAIPGTVTKAPRGTDFDVVGKIAGLKVQLIVDRDAVCERVVTGTETVTVPATEAQVIEAQPERTEEREIVTWRCAPLLADQSAVTA